MLVKFGTMIMLLRPMYCRLLRRIGGREENREEELAYFTICFTFNDFGGDRFVFVRRSTAREEEPGSHNSIIWGFRRIVD